MFKKADKPHNSTITNPVGASDSLFWLAEKYVRDLSYKDSLTGLPNRDELYERLSGLLDGSGAVSRVALVIYKIETVRQSYEPLTYDAWDALTLTIAQALMRGFDDRYLVARVSSDEFAVVAVEQDPNEVLELANSFVSNIASVVRPDSIGLTVFAGMAAAPEHGGTAERVITNAKVALFHAIKQGARSVLLFDSAVCRLARERACMIEDIWNGLKNKEFKLLYQPIIALRDGTVSGLEALMRWDRGGADMLPPSQFMVGFEDPELSVAIGEQALDLAINQIRSWLDDGVEFGRVAVNLSSAQLQLEDIADIILKKLNAANVPADRLTIELTEDVYISLAENGVERTAWKLHQSGVEIALDDFGTGYASLSHLRRLPIGKLKIDKAFVQSAESRAIVECLISLAHRLGIKIVAEGVEDQEQLSWLAGCDFAQGFMFSVPLRPEQVAPYIDEVLTHRWAVCATPKPELLQSKDVDFIDFLAAEIAVVDRRGVIVHANKKWKDTAAIGKLSPFPWNYISECEAAIKRGCSEARDVLRGLLEVLEGSRTSHIVTYACPFAGFYHWYEALISKIEISGELHAIVMHVDVSAMQLDSLTKLPNRAMFDAQAELAINSARDADCSTGLIILDINNLKWINDEYGHSIGDKAIKAVAVELHKVAGPDCVAARIGGDEFGVVLPVGHVLLLARRIQNHFGAGDACMFEGPRGPIFVCASVGVGLYPDDGTTVGELFNSADRAMYANKKVGSKK